LMPRSHHLDDEIPGFEDFAFASIDICHLQSTG